jgi:hypothetical protein
MNPKHFPILFIILLSGLTACHKAYQDPADAAVLGKWHEVKLRMYEVDNDTLKYDTTYYHPFTANDFIQFNNKGACIIGSAYDYYDASPYSPKSPQAVTPSSSMSNYMDAGAGYVITPLSTGLVNPGGFVVTDSAFVSLADTLRFQVINYGHSLSLGFKGVSEAYYVR